MCLSESDELDMSRIFGTSIIKYPVLLAIMTFVLLVFVRLMKDDFFGTRRQYRQANVNYCIIATLAIKG